MRVIFSKQRQTEVTRSLDSKVDFNFMMLLRRLFDCTSPVYHFEWRKTFETRLRKEVLFLTPGNLRL